MKRAVKAARILLLMLLLVGTAPAYSATHPAYSHEMEFGSFGVGDGQFWYPGSVGVAPWGDVWVSDPDYGRVQRFTQDGAFASLVLTTTQPGGLAWGNNALYIADQGKGQVLIMDAQGTQTFGAIGTGTPGPGDGQLDNPNGIGIDRHGNVYVTDAWNRVQKFDSEGTFLKSWGSAGSGDGEFNGAGGLAVGLDDYVYVSDVNNQRIQKFTLDGEYVAQWHAEGNALSIDGAGHLFSSEFGNRRVVKYDAMGTVLTSFGTSGTAAGQFGHHGPSGVAANTSRQVYVGDPYSNRIQRFFAPSPTETTRTAGATRFATAIAAAEHAYPRGLDVDPDGYKTVIIATAYDFPDALGGAALAGVLDAPILLVKPGEVPFDVALEIVHLEATRAIILGGTSAVSSQVKTVLEEDVPGIVRVDRVGGRDRYETANLIAREVKRIRGTDYDGVAFLATGLDFPDALAASPIAASNGEPIFLTKPSVLSSETATEMGDIGVKRIEVLGGTSAVSADAMQQAVERVGSGERLEGRTRYETAVAIARYGVDSGGLGMARTGLATGLDFPDALAGGVLHGRYRSVLLLTKRDSLPGVVQTTLEAERDGIYQLDILGGTSVITDTVRDLAAASLY